jgi:Domain of unknown function (DUF4258)
VNIARLIAALDNGNIEWERHVLERMVVRNIPRDAVIQVLKYGDCIEDYPNDFPLPSALFLGRCRDRPLHIVAALNETEPKAFVITAYEPDLEHFEPDYRTRRKP